MRRVGTAGRCMESGIFYGGLRAGNTMYRVPACPSRGGPGLKHGSGKRERTMTRQLTVIIEREGDGYVSLCPELDIASQGATVDEVRSNLKEALELFFEASSATELERRLRNGVRASRIDMAQRTGLKQ